jgi:hypothetical protein
MYSQGGHKRAGGGVVLLHMPSSYTERHAHFHWPIQVLHVQSPCLVHLPEWVSLTRTPPLHCIISSFVLDSFSLYFPRCYNPRESKLPNCPCLLSGCCWLKPHVIQSLHKGIGHDEAYWVGSGRRRREWEARQGGIWIGESKKDVNEEKLNAKKKQKTPMFHKSWGQLKLKTHFNPQNAYNIFTPNNGLGWHHYWNRDCTWLLPCMHLFQQCPRPHAFALRLLP